MVEVFGVSPARSPPARRALATRGSGFSVADPAPEAASGSAVTPSLAPDALASLLALQEAGDGAPAAAVRDREARRQGRAVLEALTACQRGLLRGAPDAEALRRLAADVATVAEASDPGLRAILAEIMLRARVELARYAIV